MTRAVIGFDCWCIPSARSLRTGGCARCASSSPVTRELSRRGTTLPSIRFRADPRAANQLPCGPSALCPAPARTSMTEVEICLVADGTVIERQSFLGHRRRRSARHRQDARVQHLLAFSPLDRSVAAPPSPASSLFALFLFFFFLFVLLFGFRFHFSVRAFREADESLLFRLAVRVLNKRGEQLQRKAMRARCPPAAGSTRSSSPHAHPTMSPVSISIPGSFR